MNYIKKLIKSIESSDQEYKTSWANETIKKLEVQSTINKQKNNIVHFVMDSEYTNKFMLDYKSSPSGAQKFILFGDIKNNKMLDQSIEADLHYASINISNGKISIDQKTRALIESADIIIVHYMFWFYPALISGLNRNALVWWEAWGNDYIHLISNKYIDDINMQVASYYGLDLSVFNPVEVLKSDPLITFIKTRVSCFFGFLYDYEKIKQKYDIDCAFVESMISNPTDHLEKNINHKHDKIIIGNSLNPTNNHFSLLLQLSNIGYDGKLYIVSSYGYDNKFYLDSLKSFAYEAFGTNAIFLEDYMKSIAYEKLISESKYMMFNHLRSQGCATALTSIYHGNGFYITKDSMLLKQLHRLFENTNIDISSIINSFSTDSPIKLKELNTNKREILEFKKVIDSRNIMKKALSI